MKNVSSAGAAGADATVYVCLVFVDTNLTQMTLHLHAPTQGRSPSVT